jgi:hypothetical protein
MAAAMLPPSQQRSAPPPPQQQDQQQEKHNAQGCPARQALENVLASVLRTYGRDRLEFEYRLGQRVAGRFVPGITEACWTSVKDALDASPAFQQPLVTDTTELMSDDGSFGKYVCDASDASKSHWVHKQRLNDVDVDTCSTWTCRASTSLEAAGDPHAGPPAAHKYARHKKRWSYAFRCWSVDLTRVASNLPHQLDNDGISYELEIELRDTTELFSRPLGDVIDWGWRLITEMCQLMTA